MFYDTKRKYQEIQNIKSRLKEKGLAYAIREMTDLVQERQRQETIISAVNQD